MLNEKIHTSQGILLICANHYRFGGLAGRFAIRNPDFTILSTTQQLNHQRLNILCQRFKFQRFSFSKRCLDTTPSCRDARILRWSVAAEPHATP
jgi:hypothetical protein